MNISRPTAKRYSVGFSLVEVALAVAIAALGIITCLGLLPEGLEMSRRTAEMTMRSNILEQIIRDMEKANWNDVLAAATPQNYYYDNQGISVPEISKDITYVVEVLFDNESHIPGSAAIAIVQTQLQNNLRRLVIRMATSSSADYEFIGKDPALYSTFYHYLARPQPLLP